MEANNLLHFSRHGWAQTIAEKDAGPDKLVFATFKSGHLGWHNEISYRKPFAVLHQTDLLSVLEVIIHSIFILQIRLELPIQSLWITRHLECVCRSLFLN
jgi:hypothetical protein